MQVILQFFKEMSPIRLAAAAVTIITFLVLFIVFISRIGGNNMETLYSGLDLQDSSKIVEELHKRNVSYTVSPDGSIIKVNKSELGDIRLNLAGAGLPTNGSVVGYELFDKEDSIGATNFSQNVKLIRALEGELSRTISAFDQVDKARVHLVIPQREIFSKERIEPRASVVLRFKGTKKLSKSEIDAISHLVITSVPGLEMKNITIVDTKGQALKIGSTEESNELTGGKGEEVRIANENRLRSVIEGLLTNSLGAGKVKAQVSLEMNFDRMVTNSEIFDPDSSVVRSVQAIDEREQTPVSNVLGQDVSVANNIPGGGAADDSIANKFAIIEKSDQTTNYEISKTIKNHISESGIITKMSIGILVDGVYNNNPETGELEYAPRSEEELNKIANLVKVAVGFNDDRSDKIEVVNMKFSSDLSNLDEEQDWLKEELPKLFQTLVLAIVILLVLITVIRPIALKAFDVKKTNEFGSDELKEKDFLTGGGYAASATAGAVQGNIYSSDDIYGDKSSSSSVARSNTIKKMNEIATTHSKDLVNILRKWLNEDNQ